MCAVVGEVSQSYSAAREMAVRWFGDCANHGTSTSAPRNEWDARTAIHVQEWVPATACGRWLGSQGDMQLRLQCLHREIRVHASNRRVVPGT